MKSIEKTNKFKLGVLGIGNMGGSILNGIINASIYPNHEICIYDIDQDKIKKYLVKLDIFLFKLFFSCFNNDYN